LPLNGSIYNQGLDGDAITNSSGITYASIGKIGSQSLLSGSMTTSKNYLGYEGTICFWIYITKNSNKGMLYGNSDTGASLYNRKWSLFLYPTRNDLYCWGCQKDSKNNSPNGNWQLNGVIPDNKWTHICITHNRSMQYIYINGIQVAHKEWDSSGDITFDVSTPLMNNDVGRYLQDYRIYDNCLSPRQVKKISKGLICHYPLGEVDGKIGGRNLIKNGKGNVKAGFFKNFPTVTDEYGEFTLKSKKTYKGIILDGFVYECRDYPVGEKYTWSYDIMYTAWNFPTGSNRGELWMGQRYVNAPSGETATGAWRGVTQHNLPVVGQDGCELNKWYHVKQTVTIPQQASSNVGQQGIISFYNSNANVEASFTARIKNVKLEKSSTATPWTPAPEDDASFYDNVIYDTSGYCNNGSVTDSTCPTWSSDTPRYKGSYVFNGNKQVIDTPNVFHQEDITISFWFKRLKDTNTRQFLFTIWEGFSCELTADDIPLFRIATDVSHAVDALSDKKITVNDGWTHFCGVYKNGEYSKIYINGQLKKSVSSASKIYWNIHSSKIGIYNSLNTYYNGQISDVRIYATALSDSDILELYQSSASVDNNGNLMLAGEVIEE
jgi:hypothetical protein